jgi:hypothetical protein
MWPLSIRNARLGSSTDSPMRWRRSAGTPQPANPDSPAAFLEPWRGHPMSPLYTAGGVAGLATIVQAREVDPSGSRIHLTGRASAVSMKAGVRAPAFCFCTERFPRCHEAELQYEDFCPSPAYSQGGSPEKSARVTRPVGPCAGADRPAHDSLQTGRAPTTLSV